MQRIYSKDFNKYYKKLDPKIKERVWDAIQKLPDGQYIKLQGNQTPPLFRIRVGKYRIIFKIEENIIYIVTMDSRGDIYKSI